MKFHAVSSRRNPHGAEARIGADDFHRFPVHPGVPPRIEIVVKHEHAVRLDWTPSTDPETGVDYYNVYRQDAFLGVAEGATFLDTGVDPAVTYTYEVSAVNHDEVESARSAPPVTVRIFGLDSVVATNPMTISVTFTEAVALASAQDTDNYEVTYNGGAQTLGIAGAVLQPGGTTVLLTPTTPLVEDVTYTLTINDVVAQSGTPIIPDSASTATKSSPHRSNMRVYAAAWARNDASSPSSSRSNEYASFMMNSRTRISPPRGRGSSRSFVWKW